VNIIFMGTPTFALPTLDAMASEHTVRAVFTRPDAVSHRGRRLLPSLVKARAEELGIPVYTPESFYASLGPCEPLLDTQGTRVADASVIADMQKYAPDLIVVVAYGMLLPAEILDVPAWGCLNLHASLLPRWRGAAPIQRALLAGDEQVGVSVMRMDAGLDTGPYCLQAQTAALGKTYPELIVEMGVMGAELLVPNLEDIVAGRVEWTQQDERFVTYADKVAKGSINLDPRLTVAENYNRVRASSHHARCRATLFGRPVMVLDARPARGLSDEGVYYGCVDGLLEILLLKPDGSREMTGAAFRAGLRRTKDCEDL
jgi:methionyl-tRNA formyltransferase